MSQHGVMNGALTADSLPGINRTLSVSSCHWRVGVKGRIDGWRDSIFRLCAGPLPRWSIYKQTWILIFSLSFLTITSTNPTRSSSVSSTALPFHVLFHASNFRTREPSGKRLVPPPRHSDLLMLSMYNTRILRGTNVRAVTKTSNKWSQGSGIEKDFPTSVSEIRFGGKRARA